MMQDHFHTAHEDVAFNVAEQNNADDDQGWTYTVTVTQCPTTKRYTYLVAVFDEDGEFVDYL